MGMKFFAIKKKLMCKVGETNDKEKCGISRNA